MIIFRKAKLSQPAELVYRRVNESLPLMGMQSYDKKSTTAIKNQMQALPKITLPKMK